MLMKDLMSARARRQAWIGTVLAGLLTLAGCGYKGPLYLPPPPDPDPSLTAPPAAPAGSMSPEPDLQHDPADDA